MRCTLSEITMMKQSYKFIWLACLLALPIPRPSLADEVKEENARKCITASVIRHTKVLDDSNILFYVRGKSIYHNILPKQCKGLTREGRFSYRRSTSSLCNHDTIRILYGSGTGLQEGRSCRLGYFHEITEEDIAMISARMYRPPQAEPLPPAEPEEIIEETDES